MSLLSATLLLVLVLDPFGNLPVFVAVLRRVRPQRRQRVIFRELLIAYVILLSFLLAGPQALQVLRVSQPALAISGGLILLLVAIRMVFPAQNPTGPEVSEQEPFIVPMAVPLIAGPAAMTMLLILSHSAPDRLGTWILSLTLAWGLGAIVLSLSGVLHRLLGERGIRAAERLMGMILILLAVQMFLDGVRSFLVEMGLPVGEIRASTLS